MTPVLSWVYVVLLTGLKGAHGLTSFPENVVMAAEHKDVTLTCDSATPGNVTWMFKSNGEVRGCESGHACRQDGRHLLVSYEGAPQLGEYSCWSGKTKLWSAYLVLEDNENSMLSCSAKSYNCVFSCLWNDADDRYTVVRIGLGKECAEDSKNCLWVTNSSRNPEHGFRFELSHSLTPYTEETTMIEVTAQAMTDDFTFHRTTMRFHLRDIIKPESPRITRCQVVDKELNVTIEPASSWSVPHSYFKLEHNIEYMSIDDGQIYQSCSHLIPRGIRQLRARSRDSLVPSAWSEWSQWTNVRKPRRPTKKSKKGFRSVGCRFDSRDRREKKMWVERVTEQSIPPLNIHG